MENSPKKKEWYQTCWGIGFIILFFLPVAIWWIWAKSKWTPQVKWIITGVIAVFFIISVVVDSTSTPPPTTTPKSKTTTPVKTLTPEEQAKKAEEEATAKAKAEADAKAKAEAEKELDAEVRFSSVAFQIKNKEAQDWTACKFVLNGKLFGSDYTYKTTAGIIANDSIIIPMNEFTKGDGTRFDPYAIKAKNIFISCNVGANLRTGYFTISE